ncbi:MAG: hypothetical protein H5T39_00055 [Methanobacteriales archaeon]|nr:hypothetical protein [Methanobacteriaceae archaeon]MBC7096076.1 hypothetical protein [Methanobacteriales archaeon]
MPSNKLAWLAICIIFLLAISTSGCIGSKRAYNGTYMSFEYPEDWNITKPVFLDRGEIEERECVGIRSEDGFIGVAAYKRASLEDIESIWIAGMMMQGPDIEISGPEYKTIDGVHCTIYTERMYKGSSLIPKFIDKHYFFQKDGRTFAIRCNIEVDDVAEDIIKSIKPK